MPSRVGAARKEENDTGLLGHAKHRSAAARHALANAVVTEWRISQKSVQISFFLPSFLPPRESYWSNNTNTPACISFQKITGMLIQTKLI